MGSVLPESRLFAPLQVGTHKIQNRVAMAPLTRFRADDDHAPVDGFQDVYYSQRGAVPGTLLITEATFISQRAGGYDNAPGIYSDAHIDQWKKVTDAVHKKGSFIWLQLWALGRAASPDVLAKDGHKVVSASNIPFEGGATPTPLTEDEIVAYVRDYAQAAANAIEAGFDGVEIHGANGYLIDQFLQDVSNDRADRWGGSVENRSRFALEVARAVVDAVGAERTAIRLSPFSSFQGMKMADPKPQFTHVVRGLKELKLAYLHLVEPRVDGNEVKASTPEDESVRFVLEAWANSSPVLLAGGFTPAQALKTVDEEFPEFDVVVVFGRYFISTPDLVYRLQKGIELAPYDRNTFYKAKSHDGYTDYPFAEGFEQAVASKI